MRYTVRPISDHTRFRGKHTVSQFRANWTDTLDLLDREIRMLRGRDVVIEVDVPERMIRNDGMLRADARAFSPAVVVAFESKHGPLLYATDRFVRPSWARSRMDDWQHNVRAIAMTLEALRLVDRYGVAEHGEQYTGYRQIGPGGATPMPSRMTVEDAARFIGKHADALPEAVRMMLIRGPGQSKAINTLYRRAARRLHPDHGGDAALFAVLQEAKRLLDKHMEGNR